MACVAVDVGHGLPAQELPKLVGGLPADEDDAVRGRGPSTDAIGRDQPEPMPRGLVHREIMAQPFGLRRRCQFLWTDNVLPG